MNVVDRDRLSILANPLTDKAIIIAGNDMLKPQKGKQIFGLLICPELSAHPVPG